MHVFVEIFFYQKYLTALRKEKESFQQLIRERAVCLHTYMVVVLSLHAVKIPLHNDHL